MTAHDMHMRTLSPAHTAAHTRSHRVPIHIFTRWYSYDQVTTTHIFIGRLSIGALAILGTAYLNAEAEVRATIAHPHPRGPIVPRHTYTTPCAHTGSQGHHRLWHHGHGTWPANPPHPRVEVQLEAGVL